MLGNIQVPGRPTNLDNTGQGPTVLEVGSGGGGLDSITLLHLFPPVYPSLWETARHRLKYCLIGSFDSKQPTNQNSCSRYSRIVNYYCIIA